MPLVELPSREKVVISVVGRGGTVLDVSSGLLGFVLLGGVCWSCRDSAYASDLVDHRRLSRLHEATMKVRYFGISRLLEGSSQHRERSVVDEMRVEEIDPCAGREDVHIADVLGGSLVLDLAVGFVRDQRAIRDRVDVDALLDDRPRCSSW
jgi:hypothetical protein